MHLPASRDEAWLALQSLIPEEEWDESAQVFSALENIYRWAWHAPRGPGHEERVCPDSCNQPPGIACWRVDSPAAILQGSAFQFQSTHTHSCTLLRSSCPSARK